MDGSTDVGLWSWEVLYLALDFGMFDYTYTTKRPHNCYKKTSGHKSVAPSAIPFTQAFGDY